MKYACSIFCFVLALASIAACLIMAGITAATQIAYMIPYIFVFAGMSLVCMMVSMEYLYHNNEP